MKIDTAGRGILRRDEAWISNTIDWEYSSNLSLMSISSYVEYETGNMHSPVDLPHAPTPLTFVTIRTNRILLNPFHNRKIGVDSI